MSDRHMLQISAEWLAKLPDHTPLWYGVESAPMHRGYKMSNRPRNIRCCGLRLRVSDSVMVWLDLREEVTAAVVAAKIVQPRWSAAMGILARATMMLGLNDEERAILARLAREIVEEG